MICLQLQVECINITGKKPSPNYNSVNDPATVSINSTCCTTLYDHSCLMTGHCSETETTNVSLNVAVISWILTQAYRNKYPGNVLCACFISCRKHFRSYTVLKIFKVDRYRSINFFMRQRSPTHFVSNCLKAIQLRWPLKRT